MALAIQPFRFDYQSGRVAPAQNITSPTWGPPDVSQMAMQGIANILPQMAKAYQGTQQQLWKERGIDAAGKLDFGQQAAALAQPGGPYAQPGSVAQAPTAPSAGAKLPTFAKVEGTAPNAEIGGLISSTASTYALAPDYLEKLVQIESGGNPNALNKGSKAAGLGQFIPSTWRQYGGGKSPFDPGANLDATARFTVDNANTLRRALGREPTQGELYLAHQQGAGSAIKLLSNPDARAFDVVPPRNVLSNLPGSLRGSARDMTARQFASLWTGRFGEPAPAFGGGPVAAAPPAIAAGPGPVGPAPGAAAQGAPVQSISGDDPAKLRADAQFYAQSNPEAARQLLARADQAEAAMRGPQQAPVAPPNPSFTSLGAQPQAPAQAPQEQAPTVQTGAPLFPVPPAGGQAMQMPPEAQGATPVAALPQMAQAPQQVPQPPPAPVPQPPAPAPVPPAPVPPALPPRQQAQAAPVMPPQAPPAQPMPMPAPQQGQPAPQAAQMRAILQAAIGSGDPTLQALAGQMMQQAQPSYSFMEAGGNIYRTDKRGGIERVISQAPPGFAILAADDPRRPAALANDPRPYQVDLKTGKMEPITPSAANAPPVQNGMQWNPQTQRYDIPVGSGQQGDTLLQPGDPRRREFGIPDDAQTWRVRPGADGRSQIEPIRNPDVRESPNFTQEKALRGEFDEKIKDYRALRGTYENMQSAIADPSPAGDISLIFGYMKMLDPTSVVREGEYATAANSGGVGDAIMNAYNKALSGERLTDKQRADFANRAGRMLERSHRQASEDEKRYRTLAEKGKLDPDNVAKLPPFEFKPIKPKEAAEPARPAVGGAGRSRANPIDVTNMSDAQIRQLPPGTYIRQGRRIGVTE